ncbi:MAG: molybdate transport system substrate-binding protein [Solirubrobacteraceae bacterium]|jgi:molybdate transport system substrate-binding protein|nr:molybdate transport system substrate-binding protein [Solirubrobacteraceae bacterium]
MSHLTRSGRRIRARSTLLVALALVAGGCGDKSSSDGGGKLVVSAAQSLNLAFGNYGQQFKQADAQFSFAGSDELATQIRGGARPDVFASANTKLPDELYKAGKVEKPVVFATNRLVLAIQKNGTEVQSLDDLTKKGVTIAIGSKDVPIGSYTRKVLGHLSSGAQKKIFANVKTEEPNVGGISAKLTQGAVDAGFLYFTDVKATNGRLEAIELPEQLQPKVAYGVAIVKGAHNKKGAQAFIDGLLKGAGLNALRDAGFDPPGG